MKKKAMIISCFDWYDKRLSPIAEYLKKAYDVYVFSSDYLHVEKQYCRNNPAITYVHVPEYSSNISFKRIRSHLSFSHSISKLLYEVNPDFVYCLLPPNDLAKRCGEYKRNNKNCILVFDLIDMWPESFPIPLLKYGLIRSKWTKIRTDGLKCADVLITECSYYINKIKDSINSMCKTYTLHLFKNQNPDINMRVRDIISRQEYDDTNIKLAYLGSINNIIDIDKICLIIKEIKTTGRSVSLSIVGGGSQTETMIQKCVQAGADVDYRGMIFDEKEIIEILCKCNYALNIMKENVSVGLTIKSIDYFSYGLPVINNIKGDTTLIIEKHGLGVNYCEGCIADFLDKCKDKDYYFSMRDEVLSAFYEMFSTRAYEDNVSMILGEIIDCEELG